MPQKKRKFLLILTGMVLAFIALETGLRIAGEFYRKKYIISSDLSPNSIPILCLGESSTVGLWLEPKDSYPKQLEVLLNDHYNTKRIKTVVPVNIGQNSSQIANRVDDYLAVYRPKLVIIMVGVNNEWSFAENNFVLFLRGTDSQMWKLRIAALWDRLRILKVTRYIYLKYSTSSEALPWRDPEYTSYPPEEWKWKFAKENYKAFTAGWKYDITQIVKKSKNVGASVLLMNYHINPLFLQAEDVQEVAKKEGIAFLINDALWHRQITLKNLTKQYVLQDGWHPNREGYAFIAANVFRTIQRKDLLGLEQR